MSYMLWCGCASKIYSIRPQRCYDFADRNRHSWDGIGQAIDGDVISVLSGIFGFTTTLVGGIHTMVCLTGMLHSNMEINPWLKIKTGSQKRGARNVNAALGT